jgi:uncharacterized protein
VANLRFEWDAEKSRRNRAKHGISFEDAVTAFGDLNSITIDDIDHSSHEDRFITIGSTQRQVVVVVSHTDRSGVIRIISARRANREERKQYYAL